MGKAEHLEKKSKQANSQAKKSRNYCKTMAHIRWLAKAS